MNNRNYDSSAFKSRDGSYNTINTYNNGINGFSPPVPDSTSSGFYVVPTWNYRPTYDTLIKGNSFNGYASITSAYGKNAENCSPQYVKKNC
jgi:hypothetical protein